MRLRNAKEFLVTSTLCLAVTCGFVGLQKHSDSHCKQQAIVAIAAGSIQCAGPDHTRGNLSGTSISNPTFGQIHRIESAPQQLQCAAKSYF